MSNESFRANDRLLDDMDHLTPHQSEDGKENRYAIDTCHFAALVLQSIAENLGPPMTGRSPYDQRWLERFSGYCVHRQDLLPAVLRALTYADSLLIPNIDIDPGELFRGPSRLLQFSSFDTFHLKESQESFEYLLKLQALVLKHPLICKFGYGSQEYQDAVERILGFKDFPDPMEVSAVAERCRFISLVLQEIRSVMMGSRDAGIPALTTIPDQWETVSPLPPNGELVLLKLYFENSLVCPAPRTITDALDLRSNSRVERWRKAMREWTYRLSKGEITTKEIGEQIREANSYFDGAKRISGIVPAWSVFVTLPVSLINHYFVGLPGVTEAGFVGSVVIPAVKAYGWLVWFSVSRPEPLKHGWFLLSEK